MLQRIKNSQTLKIAFLLVIIIALPLTILAAQRQQEIRQRAAGNFNVGFNIKSATHNSQYNDAEFCEIQNMGGKIVRVFAAKNNISDEEAAIRLDQFLAKAASHNISVIVSLIDFYGPGSNPQGTDSFYTRAWNNLRLLNSDFFTNGYKGRYLSFVRTVVSKNKNHPNIYAWEPGNELKDETNTNAFINFMNDTANTIRSIDSSHKIATGMLKAQHTGLSPDSLYPRLQNIDIITIRSYREDPDQPGEADVDWAKNHGKIAIVEEFGMQGSNRGSDIRAKINYWQGRGVTAVLHWGFVPKGSQDTGSGDRTYGMDNIWHRSDYDDLFSIYQTTNGASGRICQGPPSPSAPPPTGGSCTLSHQSPNHTSDCVNCIVNKRPDVINNIKSIHPNCSNQQIINHWCNGGVGTDGANQCNEIKTTNCQTACAANPPITITSTLSPTLTTTIPPTTKTPTRAPTKTPTPTPKKTYLPFFCPGPTGGKGIQIGWICFTTPTPRR